MKNITIIMIIASSLFAVDSVESWVNDGKAYGELKYYYIQTDKIDEATSKDTSAHANTLGGYLGYKTASLNGLEAQVTFMTTNAFSLPSNVDTSIIGRDNGVRIENNASGRVAQESFSVLGEANLKYTYKNFNINYGRQVIKTPLVHAKTVRLLPSAVEGSVANLKLDDISLSVAWMDKFKQRTSSKFIDILEHALGDKTKEITGQSSGDLYYGALKYKSDSFKINFYDYYMDNFINSIVFNMTGNIKSSQNLSLGYGFEYINQKSIENADTNLGVGGSATSGQQIFVNAFSVKLSAKYHEATLFSAYSNIASSEGKHDSLVLPWDGTPLYTDMTTSNDLFQSNYGKALNADSAYIGGSSAIKLAYTQTYDFTSVQGFKSVVSWARYSNSRADFAKAQQDFNVVLAYSVKPAFAIALKGIHVLNNTSLIALTDTVSQIDTLNQYRVIATYKF